MSLQPGTRLGPYEIIAAIGAGGMGEVYRAKDTRLDRVVAIKVLPEHLADNPERRERLEREAKALSQLNHPNICAIYDIGRQDGIDFLVMEYLEGVTLAERLDKGALAREEALRYGVQIAEGLDRAHRASIVHRDLKPANVMVTKPGVKLLDFGLAKLVERDGSPDDPEAPTVQKNLTRERAVIGTPRYMAPEQLEGGRVDARTDITLSDSSYARCWRAWISKVPRSCDASSRDALLAIRTSDGSPRKTWPRSSNGFESRMPSRTEILYRTAATSGLCGVSPQSPPSSP